MSEESLNRRRFLSRCTTALVAIIGGIMLTPALAFIAGPLKRKAGKSAAGNDLADAGDVASIPLGKWTLHPIEIIRQDGWVKTRQSRSVWVLLKSAESKDIQVLSPICTHLGCPVSWNVEGSQFRCPCHGGVFDAEGARVAGPPPRGMDALEFEMRDNHLWVRWQDFRISVAERIAVQV